MVSLEPINPVSHREIVNDWLRRPHVARWWGNPNERILEFDVTPANEHALIALNGVAVGYIRWESVDRETLDALGLSEIPDDAIDVDVFIGEPQKLGLGLAPLALKALMARLKTTTSAPLMGLCTSIENERAINAFKKAGFQKYSKYDDPESGPCWVFVRPLREPA